MKRINEFYDLAEFHSIPVMDVPLKGISAMAVCIGEKCAIGIDYEQSDSIEDEKVKLAHELGHCETGSFYNKYSPVDLISKHEYRADKWAIKELLPKSEMEEAMKNGYVEVWQLAELFEVTEEYVKKALWIYFDLLT